ncbi:hypothetical protein TrLO_g11471 [Triparma laevis f. longispina]|uniref:RRM domain-containing protein n=1 Tax=Triparma laevis f. longispina TaxID=1714387 RepID=A0A9W7C3J3_9STRA|nr:hypothetical protein TrLO_g11471 [Triparma laevis f. longispina]
MTTNANESTTVFVRGLPSTTVRSELTALFDHIGPVKKCSLIKNNDQTSLGFGFVKFLQPSHASSAASTMNGVQVEHSGKKYKLMVEIATSKADKANARSPPSATNDASSAPNSATPNDDPSPNAPPQTSPALTPSNQNLTEEEETLRRAKKRNRVIVRNLSFYAKTSHLTTSLSQFGTILEVHIPTVKTGNKATTHRGFGFVTFETQGEAQRAVDVCAKGEVEVKGRRVAVDWSVSKDEHKRGREVEKEEKENDDSDSDDDSDDSSGDDEDSSSDSSSEQEEEDCNNNNSANSSSQKKPAPTPNDVSDSCTVFLRNLPFDATQKQIFDLCIPYGQVDKIFIVTDPSTSMSKGTAFVKFKYSAAASRALEAGKVEEDAPFVQSKNLQFDANAVQTGINLNGRRVLIDLAVDREQAGKLKVERDEDGKAVKKVGRDKRNLYLKNEGQVGREGWEEMTKLEQEKRQTADKDKTTKLRSPLFFINPNRLSIRNLDKAVDETGLKKLIVTSINKGMRRVNEDDCVNLVKARGEDFRVAVGAGVPSFDSKNIKLYVPSLYIDREVLEVEGKKKTGASRGYAFVEFKEHAHALACLRELNYNKGYSKEYAAFGGKSSNGKKVDPKLVGGDGKPKTPTLCVEFTVENKAKAKKQKERIDKVKGNTIKQIKEVKKKDKSETMSRGKKQREKKRLLREGGVAAPVVDVTEKAAKKQKKERIVDAKQKKPKNKTLMADEEDKAFEKMVAEYTAGFGGEGEKKKEGGKEKGPKKSGDDRWFD